jgi:hypothetical protein
MAWQMPDAMLQNTLFETPTGEIVYNPLADASAKWTRGELAALITWEQIYWFELLAILPQETMRQERVDRRSIGS